MRYKQLTMMQRYQIEALKKEGLSQRAIALNIEVHHSTISRKLKRNSLENNEYNAVKATVSARLRYQYKTKNRRLTKKHKSYIKKCLLNRWGRDSIRYKHYCFLFPLFYIANSNIKCNFHLKLTS